MSRADRGSVDDLLGELLEYRRSGDLARSEDACRRILEVDATNPVALRCLGEIYLERDMAAEAVETLGRLVAGGPRDPQVFCSLAIAQGRMGDASGAAENFRRALAIDPDFLMAHQGLAALALPGDDDYSSLIARFHGWLKPSAYVEIGVQTGKVLALARPPTVCVGVDPVPQITHAFDAPTRVFAMTSDDFFASHRLDAELGGRDVDLAFIDGLHVFEAALKDFMNIERYARWDSVVLFHDCLPLDQATSARERRTQFWSGDTWKIVPCLKAYRPELEIFTIPAWPTGLAVVTNLDPASRVLQDHYTEILERFVPLDYDHIAAGKEEALSVFVNDWAAIRERVDRARA